MDAADTRCIILTYVYIVQGAFPVTITEELSVDFKSVKEFS